MILRALISSGLSRNNHIRVMSTATPYVSNTLRKLYGPSTDLAARSVTVLSPPGSTVPPAAKSYLEELATSAHNAAEAALCGSVLAGPSSESDEFADVAFWLPAGTSPEPGSILSALQLEPWGSFVHKTSDVSLHSTTGLPTTFGDANASSEAQTLAKLVKKLSDPRSFKIHGSDGAVAYFHVGTLAHGELGGLAGLGIQSDD